MIRRFYVHNFRCLENFELPIAGMTSSLLIGKNGSGKSTIGRALEVMQKIGRGSNRVGELLRPMDFARGRFDVPIRFEIEATLAEVTLTYHLALELPAGFRELRVREEKLAVDGEEVYVRDRAQVTLSRASGEREAKFLVDWHHVALPVVQFSPSLASIETFKLWLARMLVFSPVPSHISGDSLEDTLLPDREVTNFAEWLTGLLTLSPASYASIDKYVKILVPELSRITNPLIGKDARTLSVLFEQDRAVLTLPFGDLSDGEKCFFIGATALAANEAYGPLFCFWDEPDNYLSLSEMGDFVMDLRRSFQSSGQLVVTSHSRDTINQFSRDSTFILRRRSRFEPTRIDRLSDIQFKGDVADKLAHGDIDL